MKKFILSFLILIFSSGSFAAADDVSINMGAFLPWGGLPGVTENYSMWGLSYYHPSSIWNLEYEFLHARGDGLVYSSLSVGPRFNFPIEEFLEVFITAGLDYHYYKRPPRGDVDFKYRGSGGFHLGFGGFFIVNEHLKLRSELKFHSGPGKSVYVGLGPSVVF